LRQLVAAFRQGAEEGVRAALRKMTRRVLTTIAANHRAVAAADEASPAEDEQRPER
jgi:hypothetical protein